MRDKDVTVSITRVVSIVFNGNSGITWYRYSYPISWVVIVLLKLSSAIMMYVTFVQYGNSSIVPL